jgi:RNase adaptor protein for sRNA GlmZ degradation
MEKTEIIPRLTVKCTELRRKDQPNLAMVILPELNRLRALAEKNMQHYQIGLDMRTPSFMSSLTSVLAS